MEKPKFKTEYIRDQQTAFNIAKQIKRAILESQPAAQNISRKFLGYTREETGHNIYNFLKKNIRYSKESADNQSAATIQRIYHDKKGDCKHYSIFAASILKALKIPFVLRLISQNFYDKQPTHIYIVAKDTNGEEIIIDPCMMLYNNEARYNYKYDLKV